MQKQKFVAVSGLLAASLATASARAQNSITVGSSTVDGYVNVLGENSPAVELFGESPAFFDQDGGVVFVNLGAGFSQTGLAVPGVGLTGNDGNSGLFTLGKVGTCSPQPCIAVNSTTVLFDGNAGDGSPLLTMHGTANGTVLLDADGGGGGATLSLADGAQNRVLLDADTGVTGSEFTLRNSANVVTARVQSQQDASNTSGGMRLYDIGGTNVGIDMRGRFASGGTHGGWMSINGGGLGAISMAAIAASTGERGLLEMFNNAANVAALRATSGNGGRLRLSHPTPAQGETIDLSGNEPTFGSGILHVRRNGSTAGVRISGRYPVANSDRGGGVDVYGPSGAHNFELRGSFDGGSNASWMSMKHNGAERISLAARNGATGAGGLVEIRNGSGTATVRLVGDNGNGFGRVVTSVLEITGGADLAEPFNVQSRDREGATTTIEPGMVVSIDAEHPGELRLATSAYDPAVAGIISGAGGVRPGMVMAQNGSEADGQHHVALTGRVYCWADAAYGAIQPGDALTTSDTEGHAMKASDRARAQGAVLGKAMTALTEGRGLVLVLVQPQ